MTRRACDLLPHPMAGVSPRDPLQIILMERLRGPERGRRDDLGHDRAGPLARLIHLLLHALSDLLLAFVVIEDRRAVLRADVVALAVGRGRVVQSEEELQNVFEADLRWIELHLDRLRWSRPP